MTVSSQAPYFLLVSTTTGRVYFPPGHIDLRFEKEIDAVAYLAYEHAGPRDLHVEVLRHPLSDGEQRAMDFATKHHGDQKYGKQPYTVHLEAVRDVLDDFGMAEDERIAGLLHDTIEDTAVTREEIREKFGARVSTLVWAVSGFGKNRKERKKDAFDKMRALSGCTPPARDGGEPVAEDADAAVNLKLADRIGNAESCVRNGEVGLLQMYRDEMEAFQMALLPRGLPRMWSRLRHALSLVARV